MHIKINNNINNSQNLLKRPFSIDVNLETKRKKCIEVVKTENNEVLFSKTGTCKNNLKDPNRPIICKLELNSKLKSYKKIKCEKSKKLIINKHNKIKLINNISNQTLLDDYFTKKANTASTIGSKDEIKVSCGNNEDSGKCIEMNEKAIFKSICANSSKKFCEINPKRNEIQTKCIRVLSSRKDSPKRQDLKSSYSDAPKISPRSNTSSSNSKSSKRNFDISQYSLLKNKVSNRTSICSKAIPHYKIVAETHFAVDAFSYGNIPNVKHYFLTHFHSDHYMGLKKGFKNLLYCSKITADLCTSRLGVSPKCITVINVGETFKVEGVDITAVDANHCPGAVMLVFTLPNGKTILHTGDFRATPLMESYPIFWNKEIHSIYLDTTYCNPRYNFPTQEESIEMALDILRQKRLVLEKAEKSFSTVLIVCGTYTIGKEKFFLGIAKRLGCSLWACPEKESVLRLVDGRSVSSGAQKDCQLHVVPMKDIVHEKLQSYLQSLGSAYSEIVAFKPSGWENGKNRPVQKDNVTIHGIPYSEHSSFSEMVRFVKFLQPKQVIPTVDIPGGVKTIQKYFKCSLVDKTVDSSQNKITDYYKATNFQQKASAVT